MFTEKDLEDRIYDNPDIILDVYGFFKSIRWTKRQLIVPSGRIDLFGFGVSSHMDSLHPIIVELKNESIKSKHLAQARRYAADIEASMCGVHYNISQEFPGLPLLKTISLKPTSFVIFSGGGLTPAILHEANAMEVELFSFTLEQDVLLKGGWHFHGRYQERMKRLERELLWDLHDQLRDICGEDNGRL